ncbi:outer membrane homotrimeric porin [Pseudodesulfovibrio sp. F-1]|uniref:Outer membrane homotrimeric porin n=1 Tax=Pseudodesulfovibrio alkaliphilus TaxID=2661613 RepID=A0A7K1KLB4_9BACT|nr:outer membrane homotrimeric porin [Pseudodesulfovibrio alkaliphilus]MUM76840.1 outer membrane homotrimeric porin [Pseudodesulfovibrio alkaliphilus]
MKRLIILAVLCAFVLSAAVASAADIKASGAWVVEANWNSNWDFKTKSGANSEDREKSAFGVHQRLTNTFQFIANENLKGVLQTRYGTQNWGARSFAVGAGDSRSNSATSNRITVRQAYIDFNWPDTTVHVRAGYHGVSMPAAFGGGSMILDEEIGAVVVSGAFTDNVGYLVGYARAADGYDFNGVAAPAVNNDTKNYIDAYVAALPLSFEGFSFAPFGVYAPIGKGVTAATATGGLNHAGLSGRNATNQAGKDFDNAYWLGAAFTMDLFDPFVLKADVNYGKVSSKEEQNRRSGWLFDAALEYKGFDFMTPELFFVYTSGDKRNGNASEAGKSNRMPMLAASNWAIGSFFFGGDRLLAGSIEERNNYLGFWALGLSLKDIQSFAEGLTHDAHIIYAKGTNRTGYDYYTYGRTLTDKDSLFEVDFNTAYKLYDELTLSLDLGYLNLSTKESRFNNTAGYKGGDAWKISTGILYSF